MASRNLKTYEGMDKLPSATLKRHPKMDLNKNDLLRLLSYLEGELQARDISIAALKAEKAKQLLYQAKYGRFGLGDPFHAMQRDSDRHKDNSFDEAAVKAMYDNQLLQLENLIATQRKAQQRMREQLAAVEKRYHKVCAELEEEKQKHAQDTAQGDDVTYMLEKDRERLKQELDFEKGHNKKQDKDNKKLTTALEEERAMSAKHKRVALMLIKERKHMVEKLAVLQHHRTFIESTLKDDNTKMKTMVDGLAQESQKSLLMEAAIEKQLSEFDIEREQLKGRLGREENRNAELTNQVQQLKQQLEQYQASPHSVRGASPSGQPQPVVSVVGQNPKVFKNTAPNTPPDTRRVPIVHIRNSPDREPSPGVGVGTDPKRAITEVNNGPVASKLQERTMQSHAAHEKPVPAEKPPEFNASRVNVISGGGPTSSSVFSSPSGNTTVFTTPAGTRISLNVGPAAAAAVSSSPSPRKSGPVGRGVPPPLPPNKPQVYIPQSGTGSRRDNMVRPGGGGALPETNLPATAATHQQSKSQQSNMQKLGITISKDKITISNPSRPNESNSSRQISPLAAAGAQPASNILQPSGSGDGSAPGNRKQAQSLASQSTGTSPSPSPEMPPQNLDSFGPEMEDLQKLLVSMATEVEFIRQKQKAFDLDNSTSGSSEDHSSSVDTQSLSSSEPSSSSPSSSPASSSTPQPSSVAHTNELHKTVTSGNAPNLEEYLSQNPHIDLNAPSPDGTTALHLASELGHYEIVSILLNKGCISTPLNTDNATPLHLAAAEGNSKCAEVLLRHVPEADPSDKNGWTPLHWAATNGHLDSCRHLLDNGARIDHVNNSSWTPIHMAIHSGHPDCLDLLMTYSCGTPNQKQGDKSTGQSAAGSVEDVVNLADKDGWTVAHLAAIKETKDCLEVLARHCVLDLDRSDKWNRDVTQVASAPCKQFIQSLGNQTEKLCKVYVNVPESHGNKCIDAECHVGNMTISTETDWPALEEGLSSIFLTHLSEVEAGVKTRRIKVDQGQASSPDGQLPFSLGLSLNSIKFYSIGVYHWSPGTPTDRTPWELLCSMNTSVVAIQVFGMDDNCVDSLAYETLIPVSVLQNYLRLMEQYRNVIFYGPVGTGKSYMAKKLAQVLQLKEHQRGVTEIHSVTLTESFTPADLIRVLIEKDCLLPSTTPLTPNTRVTLLVMDDLHTVSVAALFKDVFPVIENRGPATTVSLNTDQGQGDYYMHPSCYIIGAMHRTRSTGLELSIQQRFRWVQFRCDQEPMRCLLHRHLQRRLVNSHGGKLPPPDDKVQKAVEWVVCVWQRLNEGLGKLGLLDLYYGPVVFLSCPVEPNKPKAILRWLSLLWNHQLAPAVSEAVLKGSGTDTSTGGQQKVANTALYVLMQRAIVSGCPISGQEKERYLSNFLGSNELDIKMRSERRDSTSSIPGSPQASRKVPPETLPKTSTSQAVVTPSVPFHRSSRGPITKAASLDSALKDDDSLELPDQPTYHTSPDLSPNDSKNGNTYFALAGFPVAKPMIRTPSKPAVPIPSPKVSRYGVPVIVTQPSGMFQQAPGTDMSRSLDGKLFNISESVVNHIEVKRALSPQPVGTKAWSPGPDPRRALSPGPNAFRDYQSKRLDRNANGSSDPGIDIASFARPGVLGLATNKSSPGPPAQGRFAAPVVVNPTKLQPLNRPPSAFKS